MQQFEILPQPFPGKQHDINADNCIYHQTDLYSYMLPKGTFKTYIDWCVHWIAIKEVCNFGVTLITF